MVAKLQTYCDQTHASMASLSNCKHSVQSLAQLTSIFPIVTFVSLFAFCVLTNNTPLERGFKRTVIAGVKLVNLPDQRGPMVGQAADVVDPLLSAMQAQGARAGPPRGRSSVHTSSRSPRRTGPRSSRSVHTSQRHMGHPSPNEARTMGSSKRSDAVCKLGCARRVTEY